MKKKGLEAKLLLAIRLRGRVNVPYEVEDVLKMLNLKRNNYATLIVNDATTKGMLRVVKDYVTWGEIKEDVLTYLLKERGELVGKRKLTDESVREVGFNSIGELSKALSSLSVKLNKLKPLKPFFRLHPPRKGFKRPVRRAYAMGGETGYRGEAINDLVRRMI
jgi:large subunit ribosomal protein L30